MAQRDGVVNKEGRIINLNFNIPEMVETVSLERFAVDAVAAVLVPLCLACVLT